MRNKIKKNILNIYIRIFYKKMSNYVYYNLQYSNSSDNSQQLVFDISKNLPILNNCKHYNFSIIKMFIGARSLPRMFNYILPFGNLNNNYLGNPLLGNPYKSIYAVSLYDRTTQTEVIVNLIHTPEGDYPILPPLTPASPFQDLINNTTVYQINSIVNFLNQINTAYATAVTQLVALVPALAGLQPPVISLNNQTGLLTISAPTASYSSTAGRVNAGINFRLRALIKNFQFYQFGPIYNFVFTDNGVTTSSVQETVQLDAFTLIRSIVITSDSFNIGRYYTDTVAQPGQTFSEQQNNLSQTATAGIITSLDLIDNAEGNNLRVAIAYAPTAEYRRSSFLSDEAVRRIQFRVFYQDYLGNYIPYVLEPTESISFLVMFEKLQEED